MSKTVVLLAVDRSGSMWTVKDDVIGGVNQYLETLRADTDHEYRVTLCLFNTGTDTLHQAERVDQVAPLNGETYEVYGGTALFDAIGNMISGHTAEPEDKTLVVVHTDGLENSSREWTFNAVKELVAAKTAAGWGFTFLGAGVDTWQGQQLGFASGGTINSSAGTRGLYEGLGHGTVAYSSGAVDPHGVTQTARKFSQIRHDEAETPDAE